MSDVIILLIWAVLLVFLVIPSFVLGYFAYKLLLNKSLSIFLGGVVGFVIDSSVAWLVYLQDPLSFHGYFAFAAVAVALPFTFFGAWLGIIYYQRRIKLEERQK